jgi:hypothetical protein
LLDSVTLGVATSTFPVLAPAGTVAEISDLDTTSKAASEPLNLTLVAPANPFPRILTTSPTTARLGVPHPWYRKRSSQGLCRKGDRRHRKQRNNNEPSPFAGASISRFIVTVFLVGKLRFAAIIAVENTSFCID